MRTFTIIKYFTDLWCGWSWTLKDITEFWTVYQVQYPLFITHTHTIPVSVPLELQLYIYFTCYIYLIIIIIIITMAVHVTKQQSILSLVSVVLILVLLLLWGVVILIWCWWDGENWYVFYSETLCFDLGFSRNIWTWGAALTTYRIWATGGLQVPGLWPSSATFSSKNWPAMNTGNVTEVYTCSLCSVCSSWPAILWTLINCKNVNDVFAFSSLQRDFSLSNSYLEIPFSPFLQCFL